MLENKEDSGDAFVVLVNKDKIKQLIPSDSVSEDETDLYIPVQLSFFADSKIDAILSLAIRTKNGEITQNAKLVRQALGSMREVIYNQRQEFLEKWCMRLGERVDDINQSNMPENSDEAHNIAMEFAFKAIFNMAQILAVHDDDSIKVDEICNSFTYDSYGNRTKKISKYIEERYLNNLLADNSSDRYNYVIDFCKKAEMYAEEFVSSEGKLKGRLSAPTVRELKNISQTSNPVHARILIQGEPGGGKGVAAKDFHLYCMKENAKQIIEKGLESDYLKDVKENLDAIFRLPAIF